MRLFRNISLFFFALSLGAFGQVDSLNKAIDHYMNKNYKKARATIDHTVNHPSTSGTPNAWYLRGLIYKEIFKNFEATDSKSKARDEAVTSFFKVIELDNSPEKKFIDADLKQSLKYLGSTYYNTSVEFFTKDGYQTAINYFEAFKRCYLAADPTFQWKASHVEFYLSMGTAMETIFTSNRKVNLPYMDVTATMFKKVLEVDSTNITAFYNLCMLYYNHGVSFINEMNDDIDIVDIDIVQEKALVFLKQALPYALKAYELNPKRRETLVALSGIYFSMHEEEKSAKIKAEIDILDGK